MRGSRAKKLRKTVMTQAVDMELNYRIHKVGRKFLGSMGHMHRGRYVKPVLSAEDKLKYEKSHG